MRYLIVKSSAIGDLIQSLPVLEYLKKKDSKATIDWIVEEPFAELLRAHPLVTQVIPVETKKWRKGRGWRGLFAFYKILRQNRYDLLIDLQGNTKSALFSLPVRAKERISFRGKSLSEVGNYLLRAKRYEVESGIDVRERYLQLVRSHFKDQEPFIWQNLLLQSAPPVMPETSHIKLMVSPGSNWSNKRLLEEQLFSLLSKLQEKYNPTFYFTAGSLQEEKLLDQLKLRYPNSCAIIRPTLPAWQRLMAEMNGLIAVDSAALHLCATTKTPTFSLFGPSSSRVYGPKGRRDISLQGSCPYGQKFEMRCPKLRSCPTGACLHDLSMDHVFKALKGWMDALCIRN